MWLVSHCPCQENRRPKGWRFSYCGQVDSGSFLWFNVVSFFHIYPRQKEVMNG